MHAVCKAHVCRSRPGKSPRVRGRFVGWLALELGLRRSEIVIEGDLTGRKGVLLNQRDQQVQPG